MARQGNRAGRRAVPVGVPCALVAVAVLVAADLIFRFIQTQLPGEIIYCPFVPPTEFEQFQGATQLASPIAKDE